MISSPRRLLRLAGTSTLVYGGVQVMRMVTNIVLARLLAPELFGIMLIINSLRTGVDLFTDVGIGQNIIVSKHANEPDFYNTAFTIQAMRGVGLCILGCALAYPLSQIYDLPILAGALPIASIWFLLGGLESTARFVVQRRMQIGRQSIFEITTQTISAAAHILLAWMWPSVWALVCGGLVTSIAMLVGSYWLDPSIRHRFTLNKAFAWEILHFGKWLFFSSILYFLATNLDRLYLGTAVPLALLGVYGVARSLADVPGTLALRLGNSIVFPLIAASAHDIEGAKQSYRQPRMVFVLVAALGTALFAVGGSLFVRIAYDNRYEVAATLIPLLAVSLWFHMLSMTNESILLGIKKPIWQTSANAAKVAALAIGLPLGVAKGGLTGVLIGAMIAEVLRYAVLLIGQRRHGLSFLRQDVTATMAAVAMTLALGGVLQWVGVDHRWHWSEMSQRRA
jgi:O-antigen/teichoic acid export membrane protein